MKKYKQIFDNKINLQIIHIISYYNVKPKMAFRTSKFKLLAIHIYIKFYLKTFTIYRQNKVLIQYHFCSCILIR